ncbi:broad-complex core protein isoforms 1/2/3/4/5-like isoform X3 [Amphibalanus amphitrite]|uniref:broad-complex core protein isoforms 1/2/3/4/5-like isoform X3 n=1 Tax=Amphibalanus amphitrite TaxID=1232801 RepID=UPI001C92A8DF|nr:broad-complex core protein isoforms 1/2/3/4/5-like isoform X3 [Amphibalanus amphitrite]XP_043245970.1 broad-complex core protein isoforms 1/2/3/4/5-like isoform X3 [Amphibalanus amphitrite]XP_043245971.1 broad-complex core protein isoforms 1/2/3/4/5-like isoform X3 [Amphibalanus amphitrite]XP_043245972.1 broad-complex core protein isoforms 1/2/3/4/5-like isoform X3 [Amphibalanus amphitrite]XP_043245973.1 broad-complex core protein isoforms 1/2/3/4/5-like isoform X3 [Amphibalanus amphitrite]
MDANQKFCLKWNNFQTSVTSVFDNLRQDGELVDITLCCEGRKIKAHRMMLSACSPYFRDLLKENPCQHPVFFLKDASFVDLVAVVEFVYKGEVNVTQGQLASFLKTAEMLQVRGLAGDDYVQPGTPSSQVPTQQKQHKPPRSSASASGSAAQSPSSVRGPAAAAAAAEQPSVKRRRVSADGSSDSGPLSADSQPAEFGVKLEQPDGEEPDAGFGPPAPSGGGYDMAGYEAADVAGFLSSVADQGGAGDVIQHSSAGPSDEGAQQAAAAAGAALTGSWRCAQCNRVYKHLFSYQSHLKVHRGATTCRLCGRVYARVSLLNAHMETSHGIQRRRYHVQQPPAAGAWPAAPGRPDKVDTAGVTDSRP